MGIIILKIIGVLLITALGVCLLRWLLDNFNAWLYVKQQKPHREAVRECQKEQERKFKE